MTIEFRCGQCNQLLRVPDNSAGKNARCPKCQALMQVPASSSTSAAGPPMPAAPGLGAPPPPFPGQLPPPGHPSLPAPPPPPAFVPAPPPPPKSDDPFAFLNQPAGGMGKPPPPPGMPANPFASVGGAGHPGGNPFGGSSASALNPYASPTGGYAPAYGAAPVSADGQIRPQIVGVERVLNYAMEIWKANLGLLVGVTVIVLGITYAIALVIGIAQAALERDSPEAAAGVAVIGNILSNLVQLFLGIGQSQIALKLARRQPASIGDVFNGGARFLPLLGVGILALIGFYAGLFLCIIPGIFLALMFWPFYWLVVDEKTPALESFSVAYRITQGNLGNAFLLALLSIGIMLLGVLALCIGVIFAAPLVSMLWATAYLMMSGQLAPQPGYPRY